MKSLMALCGALALFLTSPPAFAHNLWLNPSTHYPKVGETVDIGIGWGHKYPASRIDQEVKEDTVAEIAALSPEGQAVKLERVAPAAYKLKVEKPGAYLVVARIKPGVFTMTPEGRKWADKKGVDNPIKCTAFQIVAKTLLVVGNDARNLSGRAGQPLELIPLSDPARLKKGGTFPVLVLFEGKPLAGVPVKAAYAGYEDPAGGDSHGEKPADKSKAGEPPPDKTGPAGGRRYPVETVTDGQGRAALDLDRAGHWMITLSHSVPYPDTATCDESRYNATFTFEVK